MAKMKERNQNTVQSDQCKSIEFVKCKMFNISQRNNIKSIMLLQTVQT